MRTLSDVIDFTAAGIYVGRHEESGAIFGVRGVMVDSNGKTLFMLDGQQVNHRQHFGYSTELGTPLIDDIAKLEIVNGPGAILHGSGAISGYVNMIPKNGTDFPGGTMAVEYGPVEGLRKIEGSYGFKYGTKKDLFLYGGILEAYGVKTHDTWSFDSLKEIQLDSERGLLRGTMRANMFPRPTYKVAAYWNHESFHFNTFFREDNPGMNGTWYSFNRGERPSWHSMQAGLRPKYIWELSDKEELDLTTSLLWMQHGLIPGDSINALGDLDQYGDPTSFKENHVFVCEQHTDMKAIFKTTRFNRNSVALGFSLGQKDFKVGKTYFHGGTYEIQPTDSENDDAEGATGSWREMAFFGEDVIDLTDKWVGSYGIRYDEVFFGPVKSRDDFELPAAHRVSMRGATAYEIDPTTSVKLSYQEGFRVIDMANLNFYSHFSNELKSLGYNPLPPLKPETMTSTEFNLHKAVNAIKMNLDANFFYNVYDKLIHWQDFGANNPGISQAAIDDIITNHDGWMGCHMNAPGKFKSMGFELINEWQPIDNTTLKLSYGYTRPIDVPANVLSSLNLFTSTKKQWTHYPMHQVKASIVSRYFNNKVVVGLTSILTSGFDVSKATQIENEVYDHPRINFDTSVVYNVTKNFSLKLSVKNLLRSKVPRMTFVADPYMGAMGEENRYWYLFAQYKF